MPFARIIHVLAPGIRFELSAFSFQQNESEFCLPAKVMV